jgi:hypothetical protein
MKYRKIIEINGDITTNLIEIKELWEYHKQLDTNKLDNADKMNKFLKRQRLLKLNQEEIENSFFLDVLGFTQGFVFARTGLYTWVTPSVQKQKILNRLITNKEWISN